MTQELRIAKFEDFDPTEVVQLPSQVGTDLAVKLRQPDPYKLLLSGKDNGIPDLLSNVVVSALQGTTTTTEVDPNDPEVLKGIFDLVDVVTIASFVSPEVVHDEDYIEGSGAVPLSHIKPTDRTWVLNWALGVGFNNLENFPEGQGTSDGSVDDVPEGESVPREAE